MRHANPPWADRAVIENWEAIEAALASQGVPEEWMPRGDLAELGCGHYGCVYPTSDPKIVFKVTTDETEASFVANYLALRDRGIQSLGVVQYYEIFGLKDRHRRRPMFVLWREEVPSVDCNSVEAVLMTKYNQREIGKGVDPDEARRSWFGSYEAREFRAFTSRLMKFKNVAHKAKMIADRKAGSVPEEEYFAWVSDQLDNAHKTDDLSEGQVQAILGGQWKYPYKFALFFKQTLYWAQEMSGQYYGVNVGEALWQYMEAGLFLADVHCGNIGLTEEDPGVDGRQTYAPIITDPGHSIVLDRSLANPKILTLEP